MSEKNRDRLIEGILFYKEAIKNSDNKEFSKEELIRYLDMLYLQRIETGFVEACFSYLSNLNK